MLIRLTRVREPGDTGPTVIEHVNPDAIDHVHDVLRASRDDWEFWHSTVWLRNGTVLAVSENAELIAERIRFAERVAANG